MDATTENENDTAEIMQDEGIQKVKEKKPRKPLTDKQKEILNNGRLLMLENKQKAKREAEEYREKLVLKKAELIKNGKKNIKNKLGLPLDIDSDPEEEEEEKIIIKKKPKKKVVYVEESSDEEPVVLKKIKKPRDVIPSQPQTPVATPKKLIFF